MERQQQSQILHTCVIRSYCKILFLVADPMIAEGLTYLICLVLSAERHVYKKLNIILLDLVSVACSSMCRKMGGKYPGHVFKSLLRM